MKTVDHLYHFTNDANRLKAIIASGFMPSYAKETFGKRNILVPMVSFSNILLRDVGKEEVLSYGDFAIGFTRHWGVQNGLNPVTYTYEDGLLEKNVKIYVDNAIFLSRIDEYREYFEKLSRVPKGRAFSELLELTDTSKEVTAILNFLSRNYSEEYNAPLFKLISNHAKSIGDATLPIITLTKRHEVSNSAGEKFIAYNDREWRKNYPDLSFVFETNAGELEIQKDYAKWSTEPKPHFPQDKYRLSFSIEDIKVLVVANQEQVDDLIKFLKEKFTEERIDFLLANNSLVIGTLEVLNKTGI